MPDKAYYKTILNQTTVTSSSSWSSGVLDVSDVDGIQILLHITNVTNPSMGDVNWYLNVTDASGNTCGNLGSTLTTISGNPGNMTGDYRKFLTHGGDATFTDAHFILGDYISVTFSTSAGATASFTVEIKGK